MPIRWKVLPVVETLDRIEALILQAAPLLEQCRAEARQLTKPPVRIPEYIAQPMRSLDFEGERLLSHYQQQVRKTREMIPKNAVARERAGMKPLF